MGYDDMFEVQIVRLTHLEYRNHNYAHAKDTDISIRDVDFELPRQAYY